MNKLTGFLIVLLFLIAGRALYGNYNFFFCTKLNLCNSSIINQSSDSIDAGKMISYVVEKNYESVNLYSGEDNSYYDLLTKNGVKCDYNPDALIVGDITCFNIPGYQHLYRDNRLGIEIESFRFSSSGLPTSNVLKKEETNPFLLSGNRIYDISDSGVLMFHPYIEYRDFNGNETIVDVLNKAKGSDYEGFSYDLDSGVTTIETGSLYVLSYKKGDEYPISLYYKFKDDKSYYYVINYGSECAPGPCGLKRHDIKFFIK